MEPQWGGEKVSRLQRKTTLSRIECARSKQVGLNAETKKGVGIEPTGEIFLLTFTLIGRDSKVLGKRSRAFTRSAELWLPNCYFAHDSPPCPYRKPYTARTPLKSTTFKNRKLRPHE
jgi:hypothetical protein